MKFCPRKFEVSLAELGVEGDKALPAAGLPMGWMSLHLLAQSH